MAPPAKPAWWESPWAVLTALFLVLGPFGLPMLWRSRCFTRLWKWVLTVVVMVYTAYLVWLSWRAANQILGPLQELNKLLKV